MGNALPAAAADSGIRRNLLLPIRAGQIGLRPAFGQRRWVCPELPEMGDIRLIDLGHVQVNSDYVGLFAAELAAGTSIFAHGEVKWMDIADALARIELGDIVDAATVALLLKAERGSYLVRYDKDLAELGLRPRIAGILRVRLERRPIHTLADLVGRSRWTLREFLTEAELDELDEFLRAHRSNLPA